MKPIVFCDFDGTITQVDVTDLILTEFADPSWRQVEQEWVRGVIGSRQCLECQMALVRASEQQLNALIDSVPVDPDFATFHRFLDRLAISCCILSDGFDYVVRRVLRRAGISGPLRNGTRLYSSALRFRGQRLAISFPHADPGCNHGCATCKAAIMRRLTQGRYPVIFVGDGLSDRFAVEESHAVFAKGHLFDYCQERGINCRPFETFGDVQQVLARDLKIGGRESQVRKRNAKGLVRT